MLIIGVTDPKHVSQLLRDAGGEMAFDVGANCGQSVERFLPGFEKVVAVEPAVESYEILRERYEDNPHVALVHAACTDHSGSVTLEVRDVIGTGQLTTGSKGELPWGERQSVRDVPCVTVDELTGEYGPPNLLKVDTEGHESLVLDGAQETLSGPHPYVVIEIHSRDNGVHCREVLANHNYNDLTHLFHPHYPLGSWGHSNHYWLVGT